MRTTQLRRALLRHRDTQAIFIGVFPANKLPQIPKHKTIAFIANTDPAHKPGQHWVAFFFNNEHVFFFDSYGRSPREYGFHKPMNYRKYKHFFARRIQGRGKECGFYCLYFILAMVQGKSFNLFGDDLNANDRCVRNIVQSHFALF
jgi:hypothetical protein